MARLVVPAVLVAIIAATLAVACATSKPSLDQGADQAAALPQPSALDAPPAAVSIPDAPGLNVEDLSARLRDAVAATSGVDVVDELSVRRELAACGDLAERSAAEAPCPDIVAEKFRRAAFVVASSVSRLGDVYLATVRVQRGAAEIARTNAQASDARTSLESAGREAGALLRKKLIGEGIAEKREDG